MPEFGFQYTGKDTKLAPLTMPETQRSMERATDRLFQTVEKDAAIKRGEEKDYLDLLSVDPVVVASDKVNQQNAANIDLFLKAAGDLYNERGGMLNTQDKAKLKSMKQAVLAGQNKSLVDYTRFQEEAKIMQRDAGVEYDIEEYARLAKDYIDDGKPAQTYLVPNPIDLDAQYRKMGKDMKRSRAAQFGKQGDLVTTELTDQSPLVLRDGQDGWYPEIDEDRNQPWHQEVRAMAYQPRGLRSMEKRFNALPLERQKHYYDIADQDGKEGLSPEERRNAFLEYEYDRARPYLATDLGAGGSTRQAYQFRPTNATEEAEMRSRVVQTGIFNSKDGNGYVASAEPVATTLIGTQPTIQFHRNRLEGAKHSLPMPADVFVNLPENIVLDEGGRVNARPVHIGQDGRTEWEVLTGKWVEIPEGQETPAISGWDDPNYKEENGKYYRLENASWNNPTMAMWKDVKNNLNNPNFYYGIQKVYDSWYDGASKYKPPATEEQVEEYDWSQHEVPEE